MSSSRRVSGELEELDAKCREKARETIDKVLKGLNKESIDLIDPQDLTYVLGALKRLIFGNYENYSYYNFGNPLISSIIASPGGVFVKILPVKNEIHFEKIYGLQIDFMKDLIKEEIVVPVLDEKISFFSESSDSILELVRDSIEKNMILNYYYEELFKKVSHSSSTKGERLTSYYEEAEMLVNRVSDGICELADYIGWHRALGVSASLACEELKYNALITLVQYKAVAPEMSNLLLKLLYKEGPLNAIQFMFFNSTFMTDPEFYSSSGSVLADMNDVKHGLLRLAREDMPIPSVILRNINTYVYKGLLLEVGTSIVKGTTDKERRTLLTVVKNVEKLGELHDAVRKAVESLSKEEIDLSSFIYKSLKEGFIDIHELNRRIDIYTNKVSEIYYSMSDEVKKGKKYLYTGIVASGIVSMALYPIIIGSATVESIVNALPGFIGNLSSIFGIIELSHAILKLSKYLRRLSRLNDRTRMKILRRHLSKITLRVPSVVVIDALVKQAS